MSNIVPFRSGAFCGAARAGLGETRSYELTPAELISLCRWYSAFKFVFPEAAGLLCINHENHYSCFQLYNAAGGATPKCHVIKREVAGSVDFFWMMQTGEVRGPYQTLAQITDPHIKSIELPID